MHNVGTSAQLIIILIFLVEDAEPKKLSHKQKQRAAKRAKKRTELAEKRKALKAAKKNVADKTEVVVKDAENGLDKNVKGLYS